MARNGKWKTRGRLRARRELITLSISAPKPARALPPWFRDPEITETEIHMDRLGASFAGLRIVHLTDIHHSLYTPVEEVERAVQLTNRLRPDLVAMTGDYVTLSTSYIGPVARVLGKLRARLGVFAVLGNHDFQVDPGAITKALETHRIKVLRNQHHLLRSGHDRLWIIGVDDMWWSADDLEAAIGRVPAREPKILLCHNPLGIRMAAQHGIDLVLSGHTHGGQVRLPVLGKLYGRSKLGERFVEGWNRLDDTQIYICRGIGKVFLPLRLGCPPEIACLNIQGSTNGNS